MKIKFPPIFLSRLLFILIAMIAHLPVAISQERTSNTNSIVAEVNGNKLTIADFQAYIQMRMGKNKQPDKLDKAQREQIFGEYINREILYQEALKIGIDNNPKVKAEIDKQRRNIVVSFALEHLMKITPKETDLQIEYQRFIKSIGKEYKARHILVKSESKAKQIILILNKGGNFDLLAKQFSFDASAQNGGDLGWFSNNQMIKPFIIATQKLSNGNYTRTPIQSKFGWHIIHLDGTRAISAPSYGETKQKLIISINNRRIGKYIDTLREKATIIITTIPEKEKALTKTASAR